MKHDGNPEPEKEKGMLPGQKKAEKRLIKAKTCKGARKGGGCHTTHQKKGGTGRSWSAGGLGGTKNT